MKKLKTLLTSFVLTAFVGTANFAQTLDQQQTTNVADISLSSVNSLAQSFQCGITGQLSRIEVTVNMVTTPGSYTLTIRNGAGTGGSVLNSPGQTVSISTTGVQTFNLSPTVSVTSGNTYTFQLSTATTANVRVADDNGDTYPNGTEYTN